MATLGLAISAQAATPPPASAVGACNAGTQANHHIILQRPLTLPTPVYYDAAGGRATVRPLPVCLSFGITGHFTAVLPANLQTTTGIYQLGYGHRAGEGEDQNRIVWANGPATAVWGAVLQNGTTYEFTIRKGAGGHIVFKVVNTTASPDITVFTFIPGNYFPSAAINSWWGYETQDGCASSHGHFAPDAPINMKNLFYSTTGSTSDVAYAPASGIYTTNDCGSAHHGHIETNSNGVWVFDGETH
jgi:hypothetical protein